MREIRNISTKGLGDFINYYGIPEKRKKSRICGYSGCRKTYSEWNIYGNFCSFTCRSKFIKENRKEEDEVNNEF